ncbi:MAG: hypothetical protein JWM14_1408, partial [Chitinophagaceae bacterium]|nr:hypothetical protein [Chitinophagaceae bacterium]
MKNYLLLFFLLPFSLCAQTDLEKPFKDCGMGGSITL